MKPGHLIEFTSGLFGIQRPENMAFVINRFTRKKIVHLKVLTTKGIREIKATQITKRKFNINIEISRSLSAKEIEKELLPRLKDSITRFGSTPLNMVTKGRRDTLIVEESKDIAHPQNEHDFWIKIVKFVRNNKDDFSESFTIQNLACIWYEEDSPSFDHYTTIEELLKDSFPPGVGYFDVTDNDKWNPLHPDDYTKILNEIKALERLREKLVETEDYEDEEGYIQTRHIPVGIKYAGLIPEELDLLKKIQIWMSDLVQNGRLGKGIGLAETRVHHLDKFILSQYLRFMAEDWTETRNLLQSASAMTEFLCIILSYCNITNSSLKNTFFFQI